MFSSSMEALACLIYIQRCLTMIQTKRFILRSSAVRKSVMVMFPKRTKQDRVAPHFYTNAGIIYKNPRILIQKVILLYLMFTHTFRAHIAYQNNTNVHLLSKDTALAKVDGKKCEREVEFHTMRMNDISARLRSIVLAKNYGCLRQPILAGLIPFRQFAPYNVLLRDMATVFRETNKTCYIMRSQSLFSTIVTRHTQVVAFLIVLSCSTLQLATLGKREGCKDGCNERQVAQCAITLRIIPAETITTPLNFVHNQLIWVVEATKAA